MRYSINYTVKVNLVLFQKQVMRLLKQNQQHRKSLPLNQLVVKTLSLMVNLKPY